MEEIEPRIIELSIIIPTLNEAGNIEPLLAGIEEALVDVSWEVVFVDDDSKDPTRSIVMQRAQKDPRVRLIHRIGRRGLASAVIEGILSTSAPTIAVMDADMQHDERLLPKLIAPLFAGEADVAIATRYTASGGVGDWSQTRHFMSRFASRLSRMIVKAELSDPMSGFFAITRPAFDRAVRQLTGQGYKILLDLLTSSPQQLRIRELPYVFRTRVHGEIKLDALVVL
ncbi:MAG: polyprenol monophosphomannose synthase, partial [Proteobacteria bacterium]|nr:polyprenol monophosphomannose synthase [Pseudomonadota bacterium]